MKRVFTCFLLVLLIEAMLCADARALQPVLLETPHSTAARSLVAKLGSGQEALVAVRLRDKSVVSGYVSEAGPRSFSIVNVRSGDSHSIDYRQVDRLAGYNWATGVQVQQGGGIRGKLARIAGFVLPGRRVMQNNLTTSTKLVLLGIAVGVLIAIVVAKTV